MRVCSFLCSDSLLYTSFFFFLFYMVFIHMIVHGSVHDYSVTQFFVLLLSAITEANQLSLQFVDTSSSYFNELNMNNVIISCCSYGENYLAKCFI